MSDYAVKVPAREARTAFGAGVEVLVREDGYRDEVPVSRLTTVHSHVSTSWDDLAGLVDLWRNRYPHQTYYVVVRGA